MKWILLIIVMTPQGATMTNAEYNSRDACLAAGANFSAATNNDGWRTQWSCNPK